MHCIPGDEQINKIYKSEGLELYYKPFEKFKDVFNDVATIDGCPVETAVAKLRMLDQIVASTSYV